MVDSLTQGVSETTPHTDALEPEDAANRRRTYKSLWILAGGLVAGILGDLFLRAAPLGLGLVVWVCAAMAIGGFVSRRIATPLRKQTALLALFAIGCAAGLAWRDSIVLRLLDFSLFIVCVAALAYGARLRDLRLSSVMDVPMSIAATAYHALTGSVALLGSDISWPSLGKARFSRESKAVLRGLLIALPLVLVFGKLFSDADLNFELSVKRLFDWDPTTILLHLAFIAAGTWIMTGYLRNVCIADGPLMNSGVGRPGSHALGSIEICIVLGCLNLLFLSFVIMQFPYLFGGAKHVADTAGLTAAQYARRGFFELVAVAALALPMLLLGHWMLGDANPRAERTFRALSVPLVGMLFIIMASALQRMHIYTLSFGLTELRLYVTGFMFCLAALFIWFGLSVLRGHREHFVAGAFVIGFLSLMALHVVNPDALIARTNLARTQTRVEMDPAYLSQLSADAIPVLVEAVSAKADSRIEQAIYDIRNRMPGPGKTDWRSWNWGRAHAAKPPNAK